MATLIGVKVTVAVPVLVVAVLLVAVPVAERVEPIRAGAVYTPAAEIVPTEAVHVTPGVVVESLVTVAVNVCVAPATIVAVVGVMATLIGGGAELPHPIIRANAAKPANTRENRRTFDMGVSIILKRLGPAHK